MSDTFDHEGDAWDSYEFRDHDDHYCSRARAPALPRCRRCGAQCKWLTNDAGKWQLFEQARGEHNRNVPHQCNPTTLDDFDAL